MRTILNKWTVGFVVAFLVAWGVSALFCNSIMPVVHDARLNEYVARPGIIRWRSEGWADTVYGGNGLLAQDERLVKDGRARFILWGDSQVEALGVPDRDKATAVLRTMSDDQYAMIANGKSGRKVADYYFQLPFYEKAFPRVEGHVIVLSGMEDVLPTKATERGSRLYGPPWELKPEAFTPSSVKLRWGDTIHALRLGEIVRVAKRLRDVSLRFMPGMIEAKPFMGANGSEAELEQGWVFLIQALMKQSNGFIAFAYCPFVPRLEAGSVTMDDPDYVLSRRFREVCVRQGVAFIDVTPEFKALYQDTRKLPRGFFNSPPGEGHLNVDGQALLAKALYDFFEGRATEQSLTSR